MGDTPRRNEQEEKAKLVRDRLTKTLFVIFRPLSPKLGLNNYACGRREASVRPLSVIVFSYTKKKRENLLTKQVKVGKIFSRLSVY